MKISNDIISQFVEITKQNDKVQNGVTTYGTIKILGSEKYVQIDGSDILTPMTATTNVSDGERVTLLIQDHKVLVTGNISSPATRQDDVDKTVGDKITEFDIVVTDKIQAESGRIDDLVAENVTIKGQLVAAEAEIGNLVADNVTIKDKLTANSAEIEDLKVKKIDAETANITFATIKELEATNIHVNNIEGNFAEFGNLVTENFTSVNASIENLEAKKLSVEDADIKYANIDFANIGMAAVEELFAKSGIIKDLVVGDQHITGELVGVTIKGDLIEANTLVADKLVVKGSDGLYYKLNTDGMKVEAEQTDYNSLNGSIITAKSITASKVNVDDLVAFDATIGGFKITSNSIYSGVKTSVDNTTKGIYLDNTGQIAFGDASNYIKFFKDTDGLWKLNLSANKVILSSTNKTIEETIAEVKDETSDIVDNTVKSVDVMYYLSTSNTSLSGGSWSTVAPEWVNGKYMWSKTVTTLTSGTIKESTPTCIAGATGATGPAGQNGSDGKGIKSTTVTYQASTSGTVTPTGTWSSSIPTVSAGQYLWTRTVITYTDNSTATSYSIGKMGEQGPAGQNGANGISVTGITNYYLATSASSGVTTGTTGWSTSMQSMSTTNKYLWNYEVISYSNSTTTSTTPVIIGVHGATGPAGSNGQNGSDGRGITSIVEYYLVSTASTGVTTSTSGWSTSVPTMTTTNRFLWNYEVVNYTDGGNSTGTPKVIGVYGATGATGATGSTGATGQGIDTIVEEYYLSTSKTTQTGGSWTTTPPTWSSGMYIWTRSKITYKNPTATEYTTPICDSSWEAVNEIQVGGRNLYLGTKEYDPTNPIWNFGNNGTATGTFYNGMHVVRIRGQWGRVWQYVTVKPNTEYTITCYAKSGDGETSPTRISDYGDRFTVVSRVGWSRDEYLTRNWKRFVTVIRTNSDVGDLNFRYEPWTDNYSTDSPDMYICGLKLEEGNKATDWSPAPEDVEQKITTVDNRVATVETDLDGVRTRVSKAETTITSIDGRVTSTETRLSSAEQKISADAIISTVTSSSSWSDVSSSASTALSTANTAKSTADTAKSTATSAASTASTAKNTADAAASTASTAKTTADSAKTTATSAATTASNAASTASTAKNTADTALSTANTAKSTADNAITRISSAELKITAEAILNSVNTQIGAGGAINTTSTILDKNGFTVKNGALTVQNKAGQTVLNSDTNGNLQVTGDITAGGSVGNSTIKVVDTNGNVVFGANYEGAKAKSFEVADLNTTVVPGKDGGSWNITSGYRNNMSSNMSVVEYDRFATNGIKQSVITKYDGVIMENYGGGILMGKTTVVPGEITVYSNTDKGGGNGTSTITPALISSAGSLNANNGNITVTNVNAAGSDVSYLKMIRGNGIVGAHFTSSDSGAGVRLHMYNDDGSWRTYYRFEQSGKLITPSLQVNSSEGVYVDYYISAQNIRASGATRISNLNARLVSGWYSFSGAANAPCTYGILYTAQWSADGDFAQLVIGSNNALYTRYYINGGYTAWSTK